MAFIIENGVLKAYTGRETDVMIPPEVHTIFDKSGTAAQARARRWTEPL